MNSSIDIDSGPKALLLAPGQHSVTIHSALSYQSFNHSLEKPSFSTSLPMELQAHICAFADAQSLCRISEVFREWSESSQAEDLWKAHFERDAPHAEVNARNIRWKRHYFLDYHRQQARSLEVERGTLCNWRLVNAVRLAGLVTSGISIYDSCHSCHGPDCGYRITLQSFGVTAFALPLLTNCLRGERRDEQRLLVQLYARALHLISALTTATAFLGQPDVSSKVCYSLIVSHTILLIQGDRPLRFECIESCLGKTMGVAKSLGTCASDVFRRIFCCRRRYLP